MVDTKQIAKKEIECPNCKGTGVLTVPLNHKAQTPCPTCNHSGKITIDQQE